MTDAPAEYPHNRANLWARDPGGPFVSLERELFAKARARGATIKASSADAGITHATGTKYERNDEMRKRISELRRGAEDFVGVSTACLIGELMRNAAEAREAGAYKASNEALVAVYKMVTEDKGGDMGRNTPRALSHAVTPAELKERLTRSFTKGKKPRASALPEVIEAPPVEDEEAAE